MALHEENELEKLLRLAADEPAHRPQFLEVLLDSQVYILGTTEETDSEGQISLNAGSEIGIQHWQKADGSQVIPFFTSLEVLQRSIETTGSYLALSVRSLFEMTMGANLALNPRSDYGKEFMPGEIQQLLSIGIGRSPNQRIVKKETNVLLGQPSNYPSKMIASLTQLLAKHSNVNKAYLALMHDTSTDEKPHLVIGIEAEGDIDTLMREVGNVAADTTPDGEPVDLCRVVENETGLSEYFINQTTPFYEKKWGSKLKSWFGFGRA